VTDYFARHVLTEAGLAPPQNNYDRQVKSIEQLIDLVHEPVVGHAFFDVSKVQNLGNVMGMSVWVQWRLAMGKDDFATADALIVREKLRRQLQRQIDEGKKKGASSPAPPRRAVDLATRASPRCA